MPKCFSIVLCQLTSLDERSKTYSLFGTVEQMTTEAFGVGVPLEIVSFWLTSDEEIGKPFEVKLIVESQAGEKVGETQVTNYNSSMHRHRLRVLGLQIPKGPGLYKLRMGWRPKGTADWKVEPTEWPFEVKKGDPSKELLG